MHDVNKWFTADDFARLMRGIEDRRITLTDTVAYHDGGDVHLFNVESVGHLSTEPRGETGAASDRMVIFEASGKTIGECREAGIMYSVGTEVLWQQFASFVGSTLLQ